MFRNNYTPQEKNVNSTQLAWNQINFLLTRFNFMSEQFREEINYLNDPQFDLTQFTQKLLARCQYFLILEVWNQEPHYLTNEQQVKGAKRLLRILDLNNWLKLARKIDPGWLDLWPYHLIQKQATRQLQKLGWMVRSTYSVRETTDLPPATTLPSFKGGFYDLSN